MIVETTLKFVIAKRKSIDVRVCRCCYRSYLSLNHPVIDALDSMKKGRENYAAREAIKFLERNLQGGGRLVRVQGDTETLQPGMRKPPRLELHTWCVCV